MHQGCSQAYSFRWLLGIIKEHQRLKKGLAKLDSYSSMMERCQMILLKFEKKMNI